MIYRYVSKQKVEKYAELAFVNDSNILLNKLDNVINVGRKSGSDFWGIIDSNEKPWFSTHTDNYHIQSHFLVLSEKAIKLLPSFFNQLNVNKIMNEPDLKQLRRMVIDRWEIGLSQYFQTQGLTAFSFIRSKEAALMFKTKKKNLTYTHYIKLLQIGYPLLKKRAIANKPKFQWFRNKTPIETSINKFLNSEWDFKKVLNEIRIIE
jgi:hypothetical protein